MKKINGEDVAALLHNIHEHHPKNEKIIYYEEDLLPVLKALGLPKPKWKKSLAIEDWKKERRKTK